MGWPIRQITLRGFRSFRELEAFPLSNLNVLIGANGSGKSNFLDAFRLLTAIAGQSLQNFVQNSAGGDGMLFMGPKVSPELAMGIQFGPERYEVVLSSNPSGSLHVYSDQVRYSEAGEWHQISAGVRESYLKTLADVPSFDWSDGSSASICDALLGRVVYHFQDTSLLSPMRRDQSQADWERLRGDASNIAPFLKQLKEENPENYRLILDTVRMVAPYFDDFILRIHKQGPAEFIRLEWQQKGTDFPFQAYQLSDGTIRFICLATALLQPNPPATILIDEPEIGLHPYAVAVLAGLIQSASERTQVIVATQSPSLLDHFDPEQIVVVNRRDQQSTFERLCADDYAVWRDDYSVGELWQKNVVQGGPTRE